MIYPSAKLLMDYAEQNITLPDPMNTYIDEIDTPKTYICPGGRVYVDFDLVCKDFDTRERSTKGCKIPIEDLLAFIYSRI